MYPVSTEFMEKMKSDRRRVLAKVTIDYTDPFLDQSIEVAASEQANVSYPDHVANGLLEPGAKYASLDGSWVLDGSYALAPTPEQAAVNEMGWWGSQLAGAGGVFVPPYPTLTIAFVPRPITKLQVVGDSKRQEWPVDFVISIYDALGNALHTETVVGNDQIAWSKSLDTPVTQATKMELTIQRWSHPGRQTKILEFFTSIQETYEGDEIISIRLLEEREVSHGSLPVGNISSNEIDIQLNNENRKFDAGNTASPLYNLLKPNRRIRSWLGVERDNGQKEWVPLGVFWSGDWSAPDDDVYAQTTGRDRLEFLRRTEYAPATPRQNISLYDLAVDVLTDAGLSPEEYWVDEELKEYIIPYVGTEPQSHREMLRKIVEACLGQVYCDRHGVIRVEGTKPAAEQNFVTASENANISYPSQVVDGIENPDGKYASLDGSWVLDGSFILAPETEGPQMGWWGKQLSGPDGSFAEPYPTLTVTFFDRAIEAVKVVGDSARGEYPVDFTIQVFDGNDNLLSEQQVTGNVQVATVVSIPENPTNAAKIELSIQKWSHPGRQAKILEFLNTIYKLEISPDDYFSKDNPLRYTEVANYIVVETQPVDSNGNKLPGVKVITQDDESITENGLLPFEFPSNPLVQTVEMAEEIAGRLLEIFKDPRRNLELDWRGNPAVLLGNVVSIVDSRGKNDYKVIRQEIGFTGALRARLSGRRM
jgi:hypothetical protein